MKTRLIDTMPLPFGRTARIKPNRSRFASLAAFKFPEGRVAVIYFRLRFFVLSLSLSLLFVVVFVCLLFVCVCVCVCVCVRA